VLTTNQHRENRFLLIHKEHVAHIEELSPEAFLELQKIFESVVSDNNLEGATLLVRSGHPKNTGGTVGHLHAQIISGDSDSEGYEPVIVRVG